MWEEDKDKAIRRASICKEAAREKTIWSRYSCAARHSIAIRSDPRYAEVTNCLEFQARTSVFLEMDNSPSNRDCYRLSTITCVEFLHDVLHMSFHGFHRDKEPFGDVLIPVA